jgi:glycosyltransferase involved in cell wall biosynthesis
MIVLGGGKNATAWSGWPGLGVASGAFEGAVQQQDVVRYLHAADVFLSLNDLSNVGNPLLEAMACGKPIVTVDSGTTGQLIHDGETGILLSTGEPEAVARAVTRATRSTASKVAEARPLSRQPSSGRGRNG